MRLINATKLKKATPQADGEQVAVRRFGKGHVASIPTRFARRLGLIEGISKLNVTPEDGAQVYLPTHLEVDNT